MTDTLSMGFPRQNLPVSTGSEPSKQEGGTRKASERGCHEGKPEQEVDPNRAVLIVLEKVVQRTPTLPSGQSSKNDERPGT